MRCATARGGMENVVEMEDDEDAATGLDRDERHGQLKGHSGRGLVLKRRLSCRRPALGRYLASTPCHIQLLHSASALWGGAACYFRPRSGQRYGREKGKERPGT